MQKLFLSHASDDKPFVKTLANDLKGRGHDCWLDEWEIKVGDSIIQKISKGIEDASYIILILSKKSAESKWVEREWQAKFWDQINNGKVLVLPCLLENCDIPKLLNGIKYANFVSSYSKGLGELIDALTPITTTTQEPVAIDPSPFAGEITLLIAKLHDSRILLSACVAEGIALARKMRNAALEKFCRRELEGITTPDIPADKEAHRRPWRVVECFASKIGMLNTRHHYAFQTEAGIFEFIEGNPDKFTPMSLCWNWALSAIEEGATQMSPISTAVNVMRSYGDLMPGHGNEDMQIPLYMRPNVHQKILSAIKNEFVSRLLEALPEIESDKPNVAPLS